ncbi:MAG: hypothetical protein P4L67_03850 [Candidatus Pacebacteria bacterium]|nr:hypothetical protein [Candidatus Paceibacterota bacterium]
MAYYGLGLETAIKKLNFEFRLALKKRGGGDFHSLSAIFRAYDTNRNKKLEETEFEAALAQIGYPLSFTLD